MTPQAPSVGEMVAVVRRRPELRFMLEMSTVGLEALAMSGRDDTERMLAEVLAVMSPGQRALLRFKAR